MSYSVSNVVAEAGLDNIRRWLPFAVEEQSLRDQIKNKMIRPTTIPQTIGDLQVEQAIAREALRLALDQHKELAVGLKGVQQERSVSDAFVQSASGQSLINMFTLDLIIGSGGILSHTPRRTQSMLMMVDAYEPLGITQLAVDSIFMMPHLGVLSTVHEQAATEVFVKDCLVPLGTCVAPKGTGKPGELCFSYRLLFPDERVVEGTIAVGDIRLLPLDANQEAGIELTPAREFDFGAGKGKKITGKVKGGVVGLLLDGRGRPLHIASDETVRVQQLRGWADAADLYPSESKKLRMQNEE